jgi:hypothetical protein
MLQQFYIQRETRKDSKSENTICQILRTNALPNVIKTRGAAAVKLTADNRALAHSRPTTSVRKFNSGLLTNH